MSKVAKWIFPAAGGVKGIVGTALAVVGFATGNTGLILSGASMVAGAGKKTQGQARQANILSLTLGETQREAALGRVCTGGSLIDVFSFGGQYGTDKVTRCVALADHAIDSMVGFYIDDRYYPWVGEGLQAAFSNKLSFHFRQATADGHAPPQHVLENGGWVATDRMIGITHIWIDWYVDEKVWPQGHPAIRFVFNGLRVYDPRFDPQFGYTGPNPQTWANRASHKFSRNAKVLRYAYTRGIYAEGHHGDPNYLLIGRGLTEEEAPAVRVIPDANLCDEIVDGVARYCADGMISASQQFIEVDGMFAAAMAGQIVQREGAVDVEAGQAKAVVVTITDDDLVVGEPVNFSRFLPDNDGGRINTVIGRYVEPSLGFKDQSAPVRRSLTDIQTDGGPREQTLSLPLVTEVKQADRVIEIQRLIARLERRASIVLPPKFAGLEEGDWIAWQSNRRHNGATVRYQVQAYRQPETWRMYLTLREIASSVFGVPDPVQDYVIPPPPPIVIDALQLTGVVAEAITLPGNESTIPAVRLKWTAPVDAAVLAIRAEIRRVGQTETAPTRTDEVNAGVMIATNGVGPDQALECRLVPIGDPSRPVLASNWITVSTTGLVVGDISPNAPGLSQIKADIEAAFGDIFDIDGLLTQARTDINAQGTEIAAARGGQGNLSARLSQLNQFRIDGDTALGTSITNLTARAVDTEADIIDLEIALATETGARAQAIQQVTARLRAEGQNLLKNPTGMRGVAEWAGTPNVGVIDGPAGKRFARFFGAGGNGDSFEFFSQDVAFDGPGQPLAWQSRVAVDGPVTAYCYGVALNASGANIGQLWGITVTTNPVDGRIEATGTAPAGTKSIRVHWALKATNAGYVIFWLQKLENGSIPSAWSDEATTQQLTASVTEQSLAIIDLELQQSIALFRVKAEASGNRPAIIEAYSGLGISAIAFDAAQIFYGDNTVFVDATDTIETTIGNVRYIRAQGAPFGPDSLTYWKGPNNVGAASATRAMAEAAAGAWEDSFGRAFTGAQTVSFPFDSGAPNATPINLLVQTEIASTPMRLLQAQGLMAVQASYEVFISGAGSGSGSDFSVQGSFLIKNPDGTNAAALGLNFSDFPRNVWTPVTVNLPVAALDLTTRGERRFVLNITPAGADVRTPQARNGRIRGIYGA